MIQKIRNNVFETNSSSIHSLAITKFTDNNSISLEDLKINIFYNDFGWENKEYDTIEDLLSYIWTAIHSTFKYEQSLEYIKLIKEWLPNCFFDIKGKPVDEGYGLYWDIPGYIDHCELEEFLEDIFKDKDIFKNFIFNGIIYTSNDNQTEIFGCESVTKYPKYWIKGN